MTQEVFDYRKRVLIVISEDEMNAHLILDVQPEELSTENRLKLLQEIIEKIKDKNISFGVKSEVLKGNLKNYEKILIAEGVPPEDGKDSEIKLYDFEEIKPQITEEGSANFYEINLINTVKKGDWLGERGLPTEGKNGRTVTNKIVKAKNGKLLPLKFDKKTVALVDFGDLTKLVALNNGAVYYNKGEIAVSNYLKISQDVDFEMGNVCFDGFVTITESVKENFSVIATNDLEILSPTGVNGAKDLISKEGSIIIKGGVSGKSKTIIRAKKDVFAKYLSDATIICEGTVNIGYYSINCNITARDVIVESKNGKIIGGSINAISMVSAAFFGNTNEIKTVINVEGFNREQVRQKIPLIFEELDSANLKRAQLEQELQWITRSSQENEAIEEKLKELSDLNDEIGDRNEEQKYYIQILNAKLGDGGEIRVGNTIYPGVQLQIKSYKKNIKTKTLFKNYYVFEQEIIESSS